MRTLLCSACQTENALTDEQWLAILSFSHDQHGRMSHRYSGGQREGLEELLFEVRLPPCRHCGEPLPDTLLAGHERGKTTRFSCPACQGENTARPAPEWARRLSPGVQLVYNGADEGGDDRGSAASVALPSEGASTVRFSCPSCGASLEITAKSERDLRCTYCGAESHLPEVLWQRLHPRRTAEVWTVRQDHPRAQEASPSRRR